MALTPPDLNQCQAEKPTGHSFMTFGGKPGLVRCTEKPIWIATERTPGSDGECGSMSLCDACAAQLQIQHPHSATLEVIFKMSSWQLVEAAALQGRPVDAMEYLRLLRHQQACQSLTYELIREVHPLTQGNHNNADTRARMVDILKRWTALVEI